MQKPWNFELGKAKKRPETLKPWACKSQEKARNLETLSLQGQEKARNLETLSSQGQEKARNLETLSLQKPRKGQKPWNFELGKAKKRPETLKPWACKSQEKARNLETLSLQGFKVSGLCKLQVSRFLAFSGPLEIQGFKVSDLILVAQTLKLGGFTIAKAKKKQIKQKKTKSKHNKIIEVSVRWGGARLLYLNYDGVRGVPERGCSRGWQPPGKLFKLFKWQ